jgi:ADP-ribosyl-[dinitrogen reductase] hydrolase
MTHNHAIQRIDPRDLLAPVAEAVLEAGALLRAEFHRPGGPRGAHGKAPVDVEIEQRLRERLLVLHPCDWHGEEIPREITDNPDVWVVDPQDGTRAFLKGLRGSTVSVALVRKGKPILGIIFAPTAPDDTGDFFAWAEGLPAMRNGEVLSPIGPDPVPYSNDVETDHAVFWSSKLGEVHSYGPGTIVGLNEEAGDFAAFNHEKLTPASVLAMPSIAYRLALAAAGEVDVAVSLTFGLDPYDVAGGHALLTAVGGEFVQLDGKPVVYGPHATFNGCAGGRPELLGEIVTRRLGAGCRVKRQPARPTRRLAAPGPLRRAQGVLLGQLSGDALGSFVEFQSAESIHQHHPEGVKDLRPGGCWNTLAGQPTDDSEMALALARTLVAECRFDRRSVAQAYINWAESGPFDMGGTTSAGIAALGGRGNSNSQSESNGSLMRVSPLGVFAAGKPDLAARLAREDAALTHPNPICLAASAAYAAAIAAGVGGADHRTMWSVAHSFAGEDSGAATVRAVLAGALTEGPREFKRNEGWVLTALSNAFHRLYSGQPLEHAVIETVAAGGDTDTNAAICGALLGAAQGRDAVPLRWRRLVLACRPVNAPDVRHPRPMTFWPDDALELAEALLVATDI